MALEAPFRASTGNIMSPLTRFQEMSVAIVEQLILVYSSCLIRVVSSSQNPADSQTLRPTTYVRPQSAHLLSPSSDIVGPSPVTSNGTETTEIDDEEQETVSQPAVADAADAASTSTLIKLKTNIPDHIRKSSSDEAVSVIHAPEGFQHWPMLSPLSTNVKPATFSLDNATPQAQDLKDVLNESARLRSSSSSSLDLIPESHEHETDGEMDTARSEYFATPATIEDSEIRALKAALEECWTLCNTLANLSSIHRERVFNSSGTPDAHEKAWKSCWKLCQKLYESRDDAIESSNARTNLDLCRDFCQSLFDVRQRKDVTGDSVLRVSFELNNHAQDSRTLPEAFRERTLDFYITLCHRLMKQRSELDEETDSLLRACWSLAEMLFSLRQSSREGKAPDEELLGSAVQACWELCDIFREGWTQVRPDRGTPRPSHYGYFQQSQASDVRSTTSRGSMKSKRESLKGLPDDPQPRRNKQKLPVPETPVTEFEDTGDTPISPGSESPQMPNILVLGTQSENSQGGSRGGRWSSSASNLSSYSQSSAKTSSTATTTTSAEDVNVTRIKILILKAAMNIGYNRDLADTKSGVASLRTFVKSLPTGSFGSLPSHATLLQNYKNLVLSDTTFRTTAPLPSRGRRVNATDVAASVGWMSLRSQGQYGFLRELYRLVFGFPWDEVENRKNVSIAV
ncbi:hypothetical protein M406DRAFT_258214 [Cryphonectria parasitica EP155]|uniref:DUF7624 domain-containing protein n=1 Tax=Cryphonectria parasitica (strain ATCC 38755 / EP155) TaxID=660469 RepID=A0A9P5CNP9_CRYP1|nr:uncharacterized protein M406DRAFT_258214 [Cryphonectria parasitica EP155]KAF3764552.1 hypothetical protein M406DRAFT_258214 [Cryphonectria parasitica EP155]